MVVLESSRNFSREEGGRVAKKRGRNHSKEADERNILSSPSRGDRRDVSIHDCCYLTKGAGKEGNKRKKKKKKPQGFSILGGGGASSRVIKRLLACRDRPGLETTTGWRWKTASVKRRQTLGLSMLSPRGDVRKGPDLDRCLFKGVGGGKYWRQVPWVSSERNPNRNRLKLYL